MELAKGTFPDMNDVLYIYMCVCEYIIICFIC